MATPFEGFAIIDEWRPVVGFETTYEVNDIGQVRRSGAAAKNGKGHGGGAKIGRLLTDHDNGGYRSVQLWKNGKPTMKLVHVMVAEAFLPPRPLGYEVNHDSGIKDNNLVSNLEWMTRSENMKHAYRTGLRQPIDVEKMRKSKPLCPSGHEFTPENTRLKNGRQRVCRTCHRQRVNEAKKVKRRMANA